MSKPSEYKESVVQKEEISVLKSAALTFVETINAGDPEKLMSLQTEDFTFTDLSGNTERGRQGWHDYFSDFPEYTIHVKNVFTGGNGVAIIGTTTGSHLPPEIEEKE
ncbi:MAG: nuclear transport factor 2 family protein, partial [Theionarchaea archaeon]|nr:nuclear transport factor 2 family protein [Theionarchaea archaeon]